MKLCNVVFVDSVHYEEYSHKYFKIMTLKMNLTGESDLIRIEINNRG